MTRTVVEKSESHPYCLLASDTVGHQKLLQFT